MSSIRRWAVTLAWVCSCWGFSESRGPAILPFQTHTQELAELSDLLKISGPYQWNHYVAFRNLFERSPALLEQVDLSATGFGVKAADVFARYSGQDRSPQTQSAKKRFEDFVRSHQAPPEKAPALPFHAVRTSDAEPGH